MKDNVKKNLHKATITVFSLLIFVVIIGVTGGDGKEESEKTDEVVSVISEEDTEEEKQAIVDELFVNANSQEGFKEALEKYGELDIKEVTFENGDLSITINDSTSWDANTLLYAFSGGATDVMHKIQQNPNVLNFIYIKEVVFVDQQGNEEVQSGVKVHYTKSMIESINFDNYKTIAMTNLDAFFNNAEGYSIHKSIFTNADEFTLPLPIKLSDKL